MTICQVNITMIILAPCGDRIQSIGILPPRLNQSKSNEHNYFNLVSAMIDLING